MTISDAQYTAWLAADNKSRAVLVEADAYSGAAVVTRYMSNLGYVSTPSDTPASTAYDDIVVSVPAIRSAMADVFRGRSLVSFGDIDIDNSGGGLDSWLLDKWDGRPVLMYLGDPSWPKADFRLVFSGVVADIKARDNATLTLSIRDRQRLLDVPALTTLVGGTDSTKDMRRPVCYGQCFRVRPLLIDSAARKYAVHDGQINSIDAVYDGGVAIATYTADLTLGEITLTAALTGELTVDLKGSKTGGTYVNKTADVMQRLITDRTQLVAGDIDSTAVTALNTAVPGAVGLYIDRDDATVLQALDLLVGGCGAYYAVDRSGKITCGQFDVGSGTPVVTLVDDDVVEAGVALTNRMLPFKSLRVGYARFWSTNTVGAAALTEAARQRMAQQFLVAKATNTLTGHLMALDDDVRESCFVSSGDATTEVTRLATLWGQIRRVFRITGFLAAQQVKLGDTVALDFARYGLTGGVLARVVGLRESITGGQMELEVFL
jgi:hypothetical protein